MTDMSREERDYRTQMLNAVLVTPHRDRKGTKKDTSAHQHTRETLLSYHNELLQNDPLFYGKLGYWYMQNGSIRDHMEAFVGNMFLSPVPEHRDAAHVIVSKGDQFAPYQIPRLIDFVEKDQGRNMPRCMKKAIHRWIDQLESDTARFDGAALHARKHLKYVARKTRSHLSERSRGILFTKEYPEGSVFEALRRMSNEDMEPQEVAETIVKHKIPLRIAGAYMKAVTPTVLCAVVHNMSSQELINNVGWLQDRGALDNEDLKALVQEKLKKARKDKNVAAMKTRTAISTGRVHDESIMEQLQEVGDEQLKAKGRIRRDTLLSIDKSGSMYNSIRLGVELGSLIAQSLEDGAALYAFAFDTAPYELGNPGPRMSDWEKALKFIKAGGGTACGAPTTVLTRKDIMVENIVIISDGGDGCSPFFDNAYTEYVNKTGAKPLVTFIAIDTAGNIPGRQTRLGNEIEDLKIEHRIIDFKGDKYSLPDVITILSRPSMFDLVMEIMAIELPKRAA